MKGKIKLSILLGTVLALGWGLVGIKAYQESIKKNEILAFTSNVSVAKEWQLINKMKVPHSTFYAGFINEQFGMTVGYHGATYTTSDGGKTWHEGVNKANCRYGLDLLNTKYLWTVGNYGGNRVSKNGGKTLFEVADLPLLEELPNNLVDIIDPKQVYVASPLRLAFTLDGGKEWTDVNLPKSCEKLAGMSFQTLDKGFIMDHLGQIYYTVNRGEQWKAIAQMPVKKVIRFDETPSVTMRVNENNVLTVVYSDKNEGIFSYQGDFSNTIANLSTAVKPIQWHKVQLEDRPRAIGYLSKDGLYLTTVDIVGNIHLFKMGVCVSK